MRLSLANIGHAFLSYQLSKRLQEKGWKVGDVVQAVLQYYEVQEERHKSLFDWLLEDA